MRLAVAALILIMALAAAGCAQQQTETTSPETGPPEETAPPEETSSPDTLKGYYDSIDYSCSSSADCEVKNVGNCCGEYPQCANKNARADPERVIELCAKEGKASICGFQNIEACECKNRRCQAAR